MLSSILAGFVIMPLLGLQRALWLLASLAVLAGAAVIGWLPGTRQRRVAAGLLAAALVLGGLLVPRDHLRRAYFADASLRVGAIREGATTTAAGAVRMRFHEPALRELLTPGVSMSSTGFAARRYMGLMAHLPLLFSAGGRDALLICYGVGNTARSLLAHQRLARLDVVDISDEVLSLADFFAPAHGGNPLRDPRVHVHLDDGRQHLLTTNNRYDLVTSEPPPPVSAGVVNLYSREFYGAAKRALNPGGVLAQWLPVFQLAREETLAIVAAFEAEFPHTALFQGHGYQWILLGSDQPLRIRAGRWLSATREPGVAEDLARIGVVGFGDLLASYLQNDQGLRALVRGVAPLTDDLPSIQYPRRGLYGLEVPPGLRGAPTDALALIEDRDALLGDGVLDRSTRALRSMSLVHIALPALWYGSPEARELMVGAPLMHALYFQPAHPYLLDLLRAGSDWVESAQAALDHGRDLVEARWVLARRSFYARDWGGTLAQLDRMQPQAVGPARYWLLRGGAERALGRLDVARASFRNAADASREPAFKQAMAKLVANTDRPIEPWASPLSLQSPEPE